ncbi:hypothetical protein FXN65_10720 [Metapseudomonas lalkuanensis]|uniref:Uncharacterized protein n=1 Tax=Metapseudomonas lalkuanensis TaxID=2604832 RepID=A0A5J6QJ33_9GAMM|nr:hypothetical protein [Pseudomonas lalkuanensis]QEY62524.1 hypothetical protein FXN65_10720 [Pseudomonas lalkuanensis]
MTPAKHECLMQGQSGIAKKVYECVPIAESWSSFQVMTAMRNLTGSTPDSRIVSGCLSTLVDSGLVKKIGRDQYQRIPVEQKQKSEEPKMSAPAKKQPEVSAAPARKATPLEMLGELAGEIVGMAEHMKRLATRVEDVALAVEQERESNSENLEKLRQLQAILKSL